MSLLLLEESAKKPWASHQFSDSKDNSKSHFLACTRCLVRPFTKQLSPRTTNLGSLGVAQSTRGGGESPGVRPSDLVRRSGLVVKSAGGLTPMLSPLVAESSVE